MRKSITPGILKLGDFGAGREGRKRNQAVPLQLRMI